MTLFCYVGFLLAVGLCEVTGYQASATVPSPLSSACYLKVFSWRTFLSSSSCRASASWPTATLYARVGYSVAVVVAKAVLGVMFWAIAIATSLLEEVGMLSA